MGCRSEKVCVVVFVHDHAACVVLWSARPSHSYVCGGLLFTWIVTVGTLLSKDITVTIPPEPYVYV